MNRHERNAAVRIALRARHAGDEWAYFEEVPDGTGSASRRRADGLAMNMWPSRGLELHGFEIKVDRTDWKNEASNPEKAEALGRFCDRWWLVIDDLKIIQDIDVPGPWGVLLLEGGKLKTHREASKLEPQPITKSMVASILRRASEQLKECVPKADFEAEVWKRMEAQRNHLAASSLPEQQAKRLADLEAWGLEIHRMTGVVPGAKWSLGNLERVMKLMPFKDAEDRIDQQADTIEREVKSMVKEMRRLAVGLRAHMKDATRQDNSTCVTETNVATAEETIHVEGNL
jgi:hypothetical protein